MGGTLPAQALDQGGTDEKAPRTDMSERARIQPVASAAGRVDFSPGRAVVPGWVDAHLHGSPADRTAGIGSGAGGWNRGGPGGSGRRTVNRRRNRHTPEWYRRVVLLASGTSGLAVGGFALVKAIIN